MVKRDSLVSSLRGEAVNSDAPTASISRRFGHHKSSSSSDLFTSLHSQDEELYKAGMASRSYTERGYLAPPAKDSRDAPLRYGGKVKRRRATVYDAVAGKLSPR